MGLTQLTAYLEYHQWRTLYPSEHIPPLPLQRMGVEYRTFCELCRIIRDRRKNGEKQYYKSVKFQISVLNTLKIFLGNELLARKCLPAM